VTLSQTSAKASAQALLDALDAFPEAHIIFTKANADAGGRIINQLLDEYAATQPERVYLTTSLGQLKYLSAIQLVDVVIGNSSSGLIEVPALHKPTVNIGERQQGRLKAASVIDCSEETSAIKQAINYALSAEFQMQLPNVVSLYGQAGASLKIKEVLKNYNLHDILMKKFYDLAP
jgi:UDP-N-acetylglucosamine 2-epimerase (non-hydrolysing)/GDP/UDP-N,N'-diacetylbacillosamine 2-epimerase (hydrolysing)